MVSCGDSMATVRLPPCCVSKSVSSFLDNSGPTPSPCYWCPFFRLKGSSTMQVPPPPPPPDLHRPVNCPACGGDTFGPFVRAEPLRGCCCSSVRSVTGPPGSLPSPSLVQLADSDGVVLMTHCFCTSSLPQDCVMCSRSRDAWRRTVCEKQKKQKTKTF